jgi:hypothetical protein
MATSASGDRVTGGLVPGGSARATGSGGGWGRPRRPPPAAVPGSG